MKDDDVNDVDDEDEPEEAAANNAVLKELADELADEMGDFSLELAVKRLPAVPSVREVEALLECARNEPRDYLMLRILYYTGVRAHELSNLTFADISHDDGTAFVREGKGQVDRYVLVDVRTLALILEWQKDRPLSDNIIDVERRQIHRIVHEYGSQTGLVQKYEGMLRSFSPHSLRHAFATHRYEEGMDLGALQKLLGHRHLTTTLIYVRISLQHLKKQYRETDPLRKRARRKKALRAALARLPGASIMWMDASAQSPEQIADEIDRAIRDQLVVEVYYKGGMRLVEPYHRAVSKDPKAPMQYVLTWQLDGFVNPPEPGKPPKKLPDWRSMHLAEMRDVRVLRTHFERRVHDKAILFAQFGLFGIDGGEPGQPE